MGGIKGYQGGGSALGSPAVKGLLGALTGGVGGAVMGALGAKDPSASAALGALGRKQQDNAAPDPAQTLQDGAEALEHPDVLGTPLGKYAAPAIYGAMHIGGPSEAIDQHYNNPEFAQWAGGDIG